MNYEQILKDAERHLQAAYELIYGRMHLRRVVDCGDALDQIANASNGLDRLAKSLKDASDYTKGK